MGRRRGRRRRHGLAVLRLAGTRDGRAIRTRRGTKDPRRGRSSRAGAGSPDSSALLGCVLETPTEALVNSGKTVFVDFTADWCLTCKANEAAAIERPEVARLIRENGIVALRADKTGPAPKSMKRCIGWATRRRRYRSLRFPRQFLHQADPVGRAPHEPGADHACRSPGRARPAREDPPHGADRSARTPRRRVGVHDDRPMTPDSSGRRPGNSAARRDSSCNVIRRRPTNRSRPEDPRAGPNNRRREGV